MLKSQLRRTTGQTQRAVDNFPISGQPLPRRLIHALGLVKVAAAIANRDLGKLKPELAEPIILAAREVAAGKHDDQFPIDIYQTGSGTSSNMNANEVISNRAIELTSGNRFEVKKPIHPNDHVNMGQSTNDMFPTAIHVAVGQAIAKELMPALKRFHGVLADKAKQWDSIIKIGRTHLADATPIRLGQEFSGYARQLELSLQRAVRALEAIAELPAGGTAVGTGINTHPQFGAGGPGVGQGNRRGLRRGPEPFRGQRQPRRSGRVQRSVAGYRGDAVQRGQQHSLARQWSALRFL